MKQVMKNFALEEQEEFRSFLFTNPHGDAGFMYPQELIAAEELSPIMSAVSRSSLPMQERALKFLDESKTEQARAMLPYISKLKELFRRNDGTLVVYPRTARFNNEWVLAHGHNSVKEGAFISGHAENISDIGVKKITGLPQMHPQGKSSRYINFKKSNALALEDKDLRSLPSSLADEVLGHVSHMNDRYDWATERMANAVFDDLRTKKIIKYRSEPIRIAQELENWVQNETRIDGAPPSSDRIARESQNILDKLTDEGVKKDVTSFVFDYSRYWLLAVTRVSNMFVGDARTIEEMITDMISSPRQGDRDYGHALWNEAKKITPVLLGTRSHIAVDTWEQYCESELRNWIQERLGDVQIKNNSREKYVARISPKEVPDMYSDKFNATCIAFSYLDASFTDIYQHITDTLAKEIIDRGHDKRTKWDGLHPALGQGGLMWEFTMGYHAYRDLYRHRRGARTTQLLTTRLGFEIPDLAELAGIGQEYADDMHKSALIYEKVREVDPHVAELVVPFGANCRALHSWSSQQSEYVLQLRGDQEKGHAVYVDAAREMGEFMCELQPQTYAHMRNHTKIYPKDLWKKGYRWYDATRGAV